MFVKVLWVIFISLSLNGFPISGEDATPIETSNATSVNETDISKSHTDISSSLETETNVAQPESKATINGNITHQTESNVTKKEDKSQTKTTKKPVSEVKTEKNENQNTGDIVEDVLNLTEELSSEEVTNTTRRQNSAKRPEPSFIAKLTGNLVMPSLKAKIKVGKGWNKTTEGLKNVGQGTYETIAGTAAFVRDAAKAIVKTG